MTYSKAFLLTIATFNYFRAHTTNRMFLIRSEFGSLQCISPCSIAPRFILHWAWLCCLLEVWISPAELCVNNHEVHPPWEKSSTIPNSLKLLLGMALDGCISICYSLWSVAFKKTRSEATHIPHTQTAWWTGMSMHVQQQYQAESLWSAGCKASSAG